MILYTPTYGIAYADPDTPVRQISDVTAEAAATIEDALIRGGIAPPEAQDLAQLAGRVNTAEADIDALQLVPGRKVTKTGTQPVTNVWLLLTWENYAPSADRPAGAGMWASGTPSRLVAPRAGRYRAQVSATGSTHLQIRSNAAGGSAAGLMVAAQSVQPTGSFFAATGDEIVLAAGEYVEALAYSSAADNVGTKSGYVAWFSLTYIGA